MKKLFIPIVTLLALGSLVGCNSTNEPSNNSSSTNPKVDYSDLKIACPSGAPALALFDVFNAKNIEINSDANAVSNYINANSEKDIVIAPTNLLVSKAIKEDEAPFKIASVVTFGNFYLASTGKDDNDTIDVDDYIVLFQQNGLPGKLFDYVYGKDFTNIHGVKAANDAKACLETAENINDNNNIVDYVLVPQPALLGSLKKAKENRPELAEKIKVVKDLQEDYKEKAGDKVITQAAIFVKDTTDSEKVEKVNAFLNDFKDKVNGLLEDQSTLEAKFKAIADLQLLAPKFGVANIEVLKQVLKDNTVNLGYQVASEAKESIDSFLKNLGFTNEDTSEDLYW